MAQGPPRQTGAGSDQGHAQQAGGRQAQPGHGDRCGQQRCRICQVHTAGAGPLETRDRPRTDPTRRHLSQACPKTFILHSRRFGTVAHTAYFRLPHALSVPPRVAPCNFRRPFMQNFSHPFAVKGLLLLTSAVAVSTLVACGGGGGSSASTGTLQLAMTDSPGCGYDHVYVTVTKIRVHQSATAADSDSGWRELAITSPRKIDLLSLTNGVLEELGSWPLPAGSYQQARLVLSDASMANSVVLSGTNNEIEMRTPSAQQSGYKLQARFDVTGSQLADMVLDFDACKSIVRAGNSGNYNLKPVVAVTRRLVTQIEGYVDPAIAPYVVVSTRDPDMQMRATVPDSTPGRFVIAWLPENPNYTVVISGTGRTTAAITGVPVSTPLGSTQINSPLFPITTDTSPTAQVTGT